jgi:hypothetical protein
MRNALKPTAFALVFLGIAPVAARSCTCQRPDKDDQTRWGGNEMIVQAPEKRYREIRGVIKSADDNPTAEVLVEIFDEPAYLLDQSAGRKQPKQKRLRACVTSDDGSFCFRNLPSGKYELRASLSQGWDVTHVYVILDTTKGSREPIEVSLHVGT